MAGWIKIDRNIRNHWIWSDPIKYQWWTDILMTVNHIPAKVNIGMQLYECGRGQSIMSLSNWADRWKVSKDKARNFLVLLEKDGMITHESLGKTTRITVCNYDSYQGDLHDSQTIIQRSNNDSQTITHTNKNNKKEKNEKNNKEEDIFISPEIKKLKEDFEKFNNWLDTKTKFVRKIKTQMTEEEFMKLKEKYNSKQIIKTIENLENKKDAPKKYTSVYLTVKNWLERDNK